MKRLNTDLTTSDVGLVLQHKHIDFLQNKTEESLIQAIYSQLGGVNTGVVILYGCIPTYTTTTTTNDTLTITDGAISYQGKIYEVGAITQVKTGSSVFVLKIYAPTYDPSDPSLFTDGISRNVQENRVSALSVAATGTGISNWDDVVFLDTGWILATSYGAGTSGGSIYYRRIKNKVFLRGSIGIPLISSWGSTSGQIVFLPPGFRPTTYTPSIPNSQFDTTSFGATNIVNLVLYTGEVRGGDYTTNPTHSATIFVDGISFFID